MLEIIKSGVISVSMFAVAILILNSFTATLWLLLDRLTDAMFRRMLPIATGKPTLPALFWSNYVQALLMTIATCLNSMPLIIISFGVAIYIDRKSRPWLAQHTKPISKK